MEINLTHKSIQTFLHHRPQKAAKWLLRVHKLSSISSEKEKFDQNVCNVLSEILPCKKISTYILYNTNFHSLIEVWAKIPFPHTTIQWKWMPYNSIFVSKFQKRHARTGLDLVLHKLNCSLLTTYWMKINK